ncbi:PaaI family thioesterase [Nocardia nova]|uniref:PaaI family thioesterase n=2 Tax=Nocardia nova TaxID=37330 RepID=A0A2S6AWB9_9NOCA|nr:PaaI family thioesterase [Nocardia nova]PPJ39547.1 PaaI family thioesterase [Nocardia nova]
MPDTANDARNRERHGRSMRYIFSRVPLTAELGIELVDWSTPDTVTTRMAYSKLVDNGSGTPHGGAIATLIDTTGSAAVWNGHDHERGIRGMTVSMTINYIAAAREEVVVATGRCVRRARELNFCQVVVTTDSGRIIADGSLIYRIAR